MTKTRHVDQSISEPVVWNAQQIRTTGFLAADARTLPDPIWGALVEKEPDSQNRQPAQGILRESGDFLTGKLTVTQQYDRVDIRISSENLGEIVKKGDPVHAFPEIGEFDEALKAFRPLADRWLKTRPSLRRLAFGTALVRPVENPDVALSVLNPLLKSVNLGRPGIVDFRLTLNKPCTSEIISDMQINRLMKWSVESVNIIALEVGRSVVPLETGQFTGIRLEIDINTDAGRTAKLPVSKLRKLLGELVSHGRKIAEQGEPV